MSRERGAKKRCVFFYKPGCGTQEARCQAGVEERPGGAATQACNPSEPRSRTSSRGAPLSSAGRSKRVNTHARGGGVSAHSPPCGPKLYCFM